MINDVVIEVVEGAAPTIEGDVLALKYAQYHYGLDEHVSRLRLEQGEDPSEMQPAPGDYCFLSGRSVVAARHLLVVGVVDLGEFRYREVRAFSRSVLMALEREAPKTRTLLITLHGVGFGLDEIEAFDSEVAGLMDGLTRGTLRSLRRIVFVEIDKGRAARLQNRLRELLPRGTSASFMSDPTNALERATQESLRAAGYFSESKPQVFVAMPFSSDMDDTYHYGIQGAVNSAGYLCERADLATFTGDVMQWVRKRIASADLLVAEVSEPNPNVYLELGYAWGCDIPAVLLASNVHQLAFDVRSQRCLVYESIRQLEEKLRDELVAFRTDSSNQVPQRTARRLR